MRRISPTSKGEVLKMENNELQNELDRIKEYAQSIILECDKWKHIPSAVFRHGYTQEKVNSIQRVLDRYFENLGKGVQ